jgi:hypothetical protein
MTGGRMSRKTSSLVEVLEAINALCWLGIGSKLTHALAAILADTLCFSTVLLTASFIAVMS